MLSQIVIKFGGKVFDKTNPRGENTTSNVNTEDKTTPRQLIWSLRSLRADRAGARECLRLGKSPGLYVPPKVRAGGSRTAVAGLLHLALPLGTRETRPRCAGTHSGSGLPADSCHCSAGRVNSGEKRRRGLASAVHLPNCDPGRSPGSPHHPLSACLPSLPRQRPRPATLQAAGAGGGGDTRETRDLPRGGARREH